MSKSPITCHVLDSTLGRPAQGVAVSLSVLSGGSSDAKQLAQGHTNEDGRCTDLLPSNGGASSLAPGIYRMTFETGAYFDKLNQPTFYPRVEILFTLPNTPEPHYHIPLLLSPFSYTTYRGS